MRNEELERAREALRDAGIDLALLAAPSNVCYLSGVDVPPPIDAGWEFAEGQPLVLLSVAGGQAVLLYPDSWLRSVEGTNRLQDVRLFPTVNFDTPIDGMAAFLDALRAALHDLGAGAGSATLGIEPRYLPERAGALLRDEFAALALRDATEALNRARRIKTAREIELIRHAVAAADAGQEELRRRCRDGAAGTSEVDLYAHVHAAVHHAAVGPVPIVGELVSGARTGVVHYPGGPIARTLERGDTVIQDISVRVAGYWADCTNTLVAAAEPTPDQRRFFRAARLAFEACAGALRPGAMTGDAVAAAHRAMLGQGFDGVPYCGHGIGAAVNELPRLIHYDRTVIEEGMVFAVEPGVYGGVDPGTGARAERVIVVRRDGPEILSTFRWGIEA